jgi:hypothetical protein
MTNNKLELAGAHSTPPAIWTYWVVDGLFLAGPFPGDKEQELAQDKLAVLLGAGAALFIDLMEADETNYAGEPFAPYASTASAMAAPASIVSKRFPIRDQSIPTRMAMVKILDAIDESISKQQPVYLHCWGGVGRTGSVVGCWLIRHGLATKDTVLQTIQTLRQHDKHRGARNSPETKEQEPFVRSWNLGE